MIEMRFFYKFESYPKYISNLIYRNIMESQAKANPEYAEEKSFIRS